MISVCMACYNGQKYIRQQIDSIVSQLKENDELIISDDGSKDLTCEIVLSYHDPRIKLLHNTKEHGFIGNFENALRCAKGDIIFLSDQDDVWKKDKVQKVSRQLEKYKMVVHDAELINGDGDSLGKRYYECLHSKTSFIANFWKSRWLGCCMAFRKEVLMYCLPFPSHTVAHDYWIGMMGMLKFEVKFMPDVLMYYRRHGGNASPSSEKSHETLIYKLVKKRLWLLIKIVERFLL